ncbi:MAG: sigma-70 family RNA polymerase sigma factor [Clostridiales bacterium]|nr:sigma-70 family RNA polymerase sigma factor [Clostridiales bacterium]
MSNEQLVVLIQSNDDPEGAYILQLWRKNQGLIRKIAAKYSGYAELDDLQQEGYIALCNAARLYDPDRGSSFAHYAVFWIRQSMIRYIENNSAIRLPSGAYQQLVRYKQLCAQYMAERGRMPTDAEICDSLRISEEQLDQLKKAAQTANLKSLDEVIADDDGLTIGETVMDPCDYYSDLLDKIQDEALGAVLREMLDDLPGCQGEILQLHYYDGLPLTEISRRTDESYNSVTNQKRKALNTLRRPCNSDRLLPFLPDHIISIAYGGGVETFKRTWTSSTERAALSEIEGM